MGGGGQPRRVPTALKPSRNYANLLFLPLFYSPTPETGTRRRGCASQKPFPHLLCLHKERPVDKEFPLLSCDKRRRLGGAIPIYTSTRSRVPLRNRSRFPCFRKGRREHAQWRSLQ